MVKCYLSKPEFVDKIIVILMFHHLACGLEQGH
jgi:hypothetical protein